MHAHTTRKYVLCGLKFIMFLCYRCILGFGLIPGILMFISLLYTPETPRWLVFHNRVEKARQVLRQVRHKCEVEDELEIIARARDMSTQGDSVSK